MKITEFIANYKDCFPVGEGWRPIVEKLVDDIMAISPQIEITQIKEKFGTLCFYIGGVEHKLADKIYKLIELAELESGVTCERCGTKDKVTTKGSWILTLCASCRKARNNQKR
jgi:hypothetical protein